MSLVKENIIILKTIPYGESDLIVRGLTRTGAKLGLFARTARKSRKRFGGGTLEPTHYVEVHYQPKESGGLIGLREAHLINAFQGIRKDYSRLNVGLYFVQLLDRVAQEGDVNSPTFFDLLGNGLRALETAPNPLALRTHFVVRFLETMGILEPYEPIVPFLRVPIGNHAAIDILPSHLQDAADWSQKRLLKFFRDMGIEREGPSA